MTFYASFVSPAVYERYQARYFRDLVRPLSGTMVGTTTSHVEHVLVILTGQVPPRVQNQLDHRDGTGVVSWVVPWAERSGGGGGESGLLPPLSKTQFTFTRY
jgi:hypothetical protein